MGNLCDFSATRLLRLIKNKEISPVELLESCINRIESLNETLNAFVTKSYDRAKKEALKAEKDILKNIETGPLHGLPVGLKDLEASEGILTTYGSKLYEKNIPSTDQMMVKNVRKNGAIVLGKTNTPEFGAGANTRNLVFGATGNPFNPELTCAGSSGGSAVALATSMVPLATGSDYGGSLRTPASFCGVVGFRPSPGVVPSEVRPIGLIPFSLLGPMGRNVDDTTLLLNSQCSSDYRDPFALSKLKFKKEKIDLSEIKAAFSIDLGEAPISKDYQKLFLHKISKFKHIFKKAHEDSPNFKNGHNAFEVLRGVNFVAAHGSRVKNHRKILSPNVIDNVDRGLEYSLADVSNAFLQQNKIYKDYLKFFESFDILICPASSVSPFPHKDWYVKEIDNIKMPTYMRWLAITYLPTMALACSIVLPCGLDDNNMPFGIQIMGPIGSDIKILNIARELEKFLENNVDTRRPVPNLINEKTSQK